MVVYFIIEFTKPPPPTDIELWMQNTGRPWSDDPNIKAPPVPTTFSMVQSYVMNQSTVQEVKMVFQNPTAAEFPGIIALEAQFTSGPSVASFFSDGLTFQAGDSTQKSAGYCRLESSAGSASQASLNIVQHFIPSGNTSDTKADVNQVSFQIEGPVTKDLSTGDEAPSLTLQANETLTLFVYGTIYTDQLTAGKVPTCYVSETQTWTLDSQEADISITRS